MNNTEMAKVKRAVKASILSDRQGAIRTLRSLRGSPQVSPSTSVGKIDVTYDVRELTYKDLFEALRREHLTGDPGWWERVRMFWFGYLDSNIRENLSAKPSPCCSNPTSITGGTKRR